MSLSLAVRAGRRFVNPLRALAFASLALPAAAAGLPADLGERLAGGYVRPAAAALREAAAGMEQTLAGWCGKRDAAGARAVGNAFARLATAWSGVEFLRFGPLVQGNRYERLVFWPDARGVMPRQVRALLAEQDAALLAPGALAARSVAVQGLPALEYTLYGEPALLAEPQAPAAAYACGYARAVAANVAAISAEVDEAWRPGADFGRQFARPEPGNALYRDAQEVAAEAVKSLSTGLQFARDIKLLPTLGQDPASARPRRAAFWRSGLALRTLSAGLDGMRAFYEAGRYPLPEASAWIGDSVRGELARAARALREAPPDIEAALASAEGWRAVNLAAVTLKNAKAIVDQDLAPAVGVTIGFNALDGD